MQVFVIILIVIILFIIVEFNTFIKLKNKIKQSRSSIDIYLNQRFDLIPNLIEVVKGYAQYEERVYTKITEMRKDYQTDKVKDLEKGTKLNTQCNRLLAIAENVPDLKTSEQFVNLQKSLAKMESQLQAARRIYNGDVTLYNTTISSFPNTIFAKLFRFKEETLLEIEEYKKENIKIDLS